MGVVIGKIKGSMAGIVSCESIVEFHNRLFKDNPQNQFFTKIPVFAEQTLNYVFFHIRFVVNWKLLLQQKDFGVSSIFLLWNANYLL